MWNREENYFIAWEEGTDRLKGMEPRTISVIDGSKTTREKLRSWTINERKVEQEEN